MASPRKLKLLFERDAGLCHLCGGLTVEPARLPYQRGQSDLLATLDHLIPRSQGGSRKLSNSALAHKWCNAFRGEREITNDLKAQVRSGLQEKLTRLESVAPSLPIRLSTLNPLTTTSN